MRIFQKTTLIIFFSFVFFLVACDSEKKDEKKLPSQSTGSIHNENDSGKEVATKEIQVKAKIAGSIQNARETDSELSKLRERVFNDGLVQGTSILCSTYRMIQLNGENVTNDKLADKVSTILKKQNFITFNGYKTKEEKKIKLEKIEKLKEYMKSKFASREDTPYLRKLLNDFLGAIDAILNEKEMMDADKLYEELRGLGIGDTNKYLGNILSKYEYHGEHHYGIEIPSSLPYGHIKSISFFANNEGIHREYINPNPSDEERKKSNQRIQEELSAHLQGITPAGKPKDYCAEHYLRPIPVNEEARKIEMMTFGAEIVSAIDRLDNYSAKLNIIELKAAEIHSMESTMLTLEHNYSFDLTDSSYANDQISDYDKLLNNAIQSIEETKRELKAGSTISDESVKKIIGILTQK